MDSILTNYKKDSDIEAELSNVEIENFVEFDYGGNYTFRECEYCTGPLLGHIQVKCAKLEYDEKIVKRYKTKLKNMPTFMTKIKEREERHRKKVAEWSRTETRNGVAELKKQRHAPIWTGYQSEERNRKME